MLPGGRKCFSMPPERLPSKHLLSPKKNQIFLKRSSQTVPIACCPHHHPDSLSHIPCSIPYHVPYLVYNLHYAVHISSLSSYMNECLLFYFIYSTDQKFGDTSFFNVFSLFSWQFTLWILIEGITTTNKHMESCGKQKSVKKTFRSPTVIGYLFTLIVKKWMEIH